MPFAPALKPSETWIWVRLSDDQEREFGSMPQLSDWQLTPEADLIRSLSYHHRSDSGQRINMVFTAQPSTPQSSSVENDLATVNRPSGRIKDDGKILSIETSGEDAVSILKLILNWYSGYPENTYG